MVKKSVLPAKSKKSTNHYIDNTKFYTEMVKYHRAYFDAKEAGEQLPQIPNYIGNCFLLIANRLGTNGNFRNYSFLDEMQADGIENCVRYCHNFDPNKYDKPFAYFTQIIYYAFLRRIERESKQAYIRYKSMERSIIHNTLVEMSPDDASHFQVAISTMMDEAKFATLSEKYDKKPTARKSGKVGVENLIESDDGED